LAFKELKTIYPTTAPGHACMPLPIGLIDFKF